MTPYVNQVAKISLANMSHWSMLRQKFVLFGSEKKTGRSLESLGFWDVGFGLGILPLVLLV